MRSTIRGLTVAGVALCVVTPLGAQQPQAAAQRAPQNGAARNGAPQNGAQSGAQGAPSGPTLTSTAVVGRQSWFSDRRDYHLGDIVTILVDEYTLTSLDKTVNATEDRHRTLGLGITTPSSQNQFGIDAQNNNDSQNSGTDARTNRLTTQMSARVVAIAPDGVMQLKGVKTLNVEDSKVNLTLMGWVRTQDVTADNTVQSFRMSDAQLDYQADGPLGKAKSGIIGRILGAFWP